MATGPGFDSKSNGTKRHGLSIANIPRMISVVEIIKREYLKTLNREDGSVQLYQYNRFGPSEEVLLQTNRVALDEDSRLKMVAAVLEGDDM